MAQVLKKSLKELDAIDNDELLNFVEEYANQVERNFIKMFSSEETNEYDALRAKYLGQAKPVPTFDYEIN